MRTQRCRVAVLCSSLLVGLWGGTAGAQAQTVIRGVQAFALDQPRVPALLQPLQGGTPLSVYSEEAGATLFAFDCFLDTGSSRIAMSRADTNALKVQSTAQSVQDFGIGGTETFDVSRPYNLWVADSWANTMDARQFRYSLRCVLQLRRSDQNVLNALPHGMADQFLGAMKDLGLSSADLGEMFSSAVNIVGTPFLQYYIAILDPRPVTQALGALTGLGGGGGGLTGDSLDKLLEQAEKSGTMGADFGRIRVQLLPASGRYTAPHITVPLTMRDLDPGKVPVSKTDVPFVNGVTLQHGNRSVKANLLVDTGGGVSLLSSAMAQKLGLDLRHPQLSAPVQGVGPKAGNLKGYWVDRMIVPTTSGQPILFQRAPMFVLDIAGMDGSIGMNMLGPSVYLDMVNISSDPTAILGGLRAGTLPFKRIVIDIPHRVLGLDPS